MKQWRHLQRPAMRGICRMESTQMMFRLILMNIHSECLMMSRAIMTHLMVTRLKFKVNVAVSCSDIINTAYRTLHLSMFLSPHSVIIFVLGLKLELLFVFTVSAAYSLLLYITLSPHSASLINPHLSLLCAWTPT